MTGVVEGVETQLAITHQQPADELRPLLYRDALPVQIDRQPAPFQIDAHHLGKLGPLDRLAQGAGCMPGRQRVMPGAGERRGAGRRDTPEKRPSISTSVLTQKGILAGVSTLPRRGTITGPHISPRGNIVTGMNILFIIPHHHGQEGRHRLPDTIVQDILRHALGFAITTRGQQGSRQQQAGTAKGTGDRTDHGRADGAKRRQGGQP